MVTHYYLHVVSYSMMLGAYNYVHVASTVSLVGIMHIHTQLFSFFEYL